MRRWLAVLAACGLGGCTTLSLERHSLGQTASAIEIRYHEALFNLAMIADDPNTLPAYSTIFTGTAQITDSAQLSSTTVWQHVATRLGNGFGSEAASPQLSRSVLQNWTLDPIVGPEKLEAMRCACQWVLFGPEEPCRTCAAVLVNPEQAAGTVDTRHFGVADRLAALPPDWLHRGKTHEVPLRACYKAHCGSTWVWVMSDGMKGLADFTLILQDIAHVNNNSPTLLVIRPVPSDFSFLTTPRPVIGPDGKQLIGPDGKAVADTVTATLSVDPRLQIVPNLPYYRLRMDNVGSDSHLRSQINAAGVK